MGKLESRTSSVDKNAITSDHMHAKMMGDELKILSIPVVVDRCYCSNTNAKL